MRLHSIDARKRYREKITEFNRTLISTLGVPAEPIRLPCLTLVRVHTDACSHVRHVPLEPRSTLLIVADLIGGAQAYRESITSDPVVVQGAANRFFPAMRGPLTVIDLVNTVTDFNDRPSNVVQSVLL